MTRCPDTAAIVDGWPRWLSLFMGLFIVLGAAHAHAQAPDVTATDGGLPSDAALSPPAQVPDAAPGPVDPNTLTPPTLRAFVDAGFPEAAKEARQEAAVLLAITIGDDGFVEDVQQIGEPAGYGFDELAVSAARRFVFEPATKGGVPIRSRIQYRYEFKWQPPPEAQPPPPPTDAQLLVTVRNADGDAPLEDVEIIVTSPADQAFGKRLVTDAEGRARGEGFPPGSYQLDLHLEGFRSERHEEELTAGELTELTYRLQRITGYQEFGAVARVKAPPREVTRRTIEREVLTRVAGTRGDALRAIELLPGVSRPPFTAGIILVRGSAPGDTQVLLDGVPVPLLYHFGGLTSFINSRALERIDFYPGNYSARYGRAMGGIIDVGLRDPKADKLHGVLDLNVPLDSSLLLEGPLGKKASFMVGGRRSYIGNIMAAALPDSVGPLAAPVYYDYQGFVTYKPTDRDRFRIGGYGSSDRLELLFAPNDDDPTISSFELRTQFHRAQMSWKRQYSRKLDHDIQFSLGREHNRFSFPPDFLLDLEVNQAYLRAEWKYRLNQFVQLIAGTDTVLGFYSVTFNGPALPDDNSASNSGASFDTLELSAFKLKQGFAAPAIFAEVALTPTKALRIVPGLRLDYNSLNDAFAFDPRLAAIYSVRPNWRVKGGIGVFSQPPDAPQLIKGFGNPNLMFQKAIHYSVGVEHDLTKEFSFNVEGFYKSLHDRPVVPAALTTNEVLANMGVVDRPAYINDGIGKVIGLEVAARKLASGRWFGFLSYTLMRSMRKDGDGPWRLFNYDQTHILTIAGNVLLNHGWELGGTLRVVTGNPRTPIDGAWQDLDNNSFIASDGRYNSRRSPTFNRFDFRVEKKWVFDSWRMAAYLDIQNVYNRQNPEGITYSYNYKQSANLKGLPIIPIIGVRGEL